MRIWAHCYSDKPYSMDKHQQGYPVDLGLLRYIDSQINRTDKQQYLSDSNNASQKQATNHKTNGVIICD